MVKKKIGFKNAWSNKYCGGGWEMELGGGDMNSNNRFKPTPRLKLGCGSDTIKDDIEDGNIL